MNTKTLYKLEYNKIIEQLTEHASSSRGRRYCQELVPMTSKELIEVAQEQTADAFTRIVKNGRLNFSDVHPVEESMKRLEVGAALSILELIHISRLLRVTARVKSYGRRDHDEDSMDSLDSFFDQLAPITPLSTEIDYCLISEDEVSDDASSTLRQIRRKIQQLGDKIHSTMSGMLGGAYRPYLQDAIITMRGDRYCLPVKAEYRGKVTGMIHDQSSSGSTLFVEPMAVVQINNDLMVQYAKEVEEINVILARLSDQAAQYIDEIRSNYLLLTELDFIFARGSYALSMHGSRPTFNTEGYINLKEARHPLLDPRFVVPINVSLGKDFTLLIITGPNTGGKTVSLKTVGLLTLMGQAGLHIPARDHSELAIFESVYTDIGDEQSIEQSLSTFSSHMTNIVSFLEKADENSLVLFDELGAGTDPTEGAALAISILSYLHRQGIRTMATTHYSELKVYALTTEGVENGSCEFDVASLKPTYRLLIGIPGKSNAFAISSRLGLSSHIIEEAKKHLTTHEASFEELLSELEQERKIIETSREEIERYKREVQNLKQRTQEQQQKLAKDRDRILSEAKEKANVILRDAKEMADESMSNFRKFAKDHVSLADMERERERLREKIKETSTGGLQIRSSNKRSENKASDFKLGESVKVLSMNINGTISSKPDAKGNVFVQMGILRSQVHISDLEILPDTSSQASVKKYGGGGSSMKMSKTMGIKSEINLLGMTVSDALMELDKYLDDALLAHLSSVRVVHGKGTGALRQGVHDFLKRQSYVKSYRLAEHGEGDAGVTIVEFK